jgi:hypothetical protein
MCHPVKAILVAAVLGAAVGPAAAFVEISGVFVATERCQAFDSIRRETNPGNVLTVPAQSYPARALNREDGDFVFVDVSGVVPGAVPRTRWVNLGCGDLFRQADDPQRPDDPNEPVTGFIPFFDNEDRPANDATPRPPTLSAFDRAMLKVCGDWGARPTRADFRAALDDPAVAADVTRIYDALGGAVLGPRRDPVGFREELTGIWFDEDGFRHIFCGEPSGGTIGGLHFVGRYL